MSARFPFSVMRAGLSAWSCGLMVGAWVGHRVETGAASGKEGESCRDGQCQNTARLIEKSEIEDPARSRTRYGFCCLHLKSLKVIAVGVRYCVRTRLRATRKSRTDSR